MVVAYVDRVNFAVVLTVPEFLGAFQLDDRWRGLLNSAFFWSYAVLQIPAGWVVDRHGSKFPFALGFLLWSLVSAGTALAKSVEQLFLLRLILGICESIVTPASMRWIRFNFPEQQRGLALGIYTSGSKIGTTVAVPLTTLLIRLSGWRGMFAVLGIGCLIWLIPWLILAKNDFRRANGPELPERSANPLSFAELLASPALWGIIIGAFCYSYFIMFYLTWLPAYFVERRGLSLEGMSVYTMASFAAMAIVSAPAGHLADRMIAAGRYVVRVRRGFTIAGMLLASTEVFGAFSDSNAVALFFAVLSLAGLGLTTANYWALTQTLMPASSIGRVIGIQNCANSLSGIAASLLTGWLKEATGSYEAPMAAILVFLLIGVIAYYFLARERFSPGPTFRVPLPTPSK
jgi:MFS family permease